MSNEFIRWTSVNKHRNGWWSQTTPYPTNQATYCKTPIFSTHMLGIPISLYHRPFQNQLWKWGKFCSWSSLHAPPHWLSTHHLKCSFLSNCRLSIIHYFTHHPLTSFCQQLCNSFVWTHVNTQFCPPVFSLIKVILLMSN